jgi:hypothetical protein
MLLGNLVYFLWKIFFLYNLNYTYCKVKNLQQNKETIVYLTLFFSSFLLVITSYISCIKILKWISLSDISRDTPYTHSRACTLPPIHPITLLWYIQTYIHTNRQK